MTPEELRALEDCARILEVTVRLDGAALVRKAAAEIERLTKERDALLGWREVDWPEGFDRRTAEIMAQYFAAKWR